MKNLQPSRWLLFPAASLAIALYALLDVLGMKQVYSYGKVDLIVCKAALLILLQFWISR